jgi:hypothetical protein
MYIKRSAVMLKIIVKKLDQSKSAGSAKNATVQTKRMRDSDGKIFSLRTVDAGGGNLSGDLTTVFSKNVDRARRENKKLLGVRDVAPNR